MATSLAQTAPLAVSGIGHRITNVWFAPNGVSDPVSFGGAYVTALARTGVGTYLATLTGFSPKAFLAALGYAFDNANPTNRECRIGLVTITPATKTATVVLYVSAPLGGGALADTAAHPDSVVKAGLLWKTFSGKDNSGL